MVVNTKIQNKPFNIYGINTYAMNIIPLWNEVKIRFLKVEFKYLDFF